MRRVALPLLLLIAVVAAGCGGADASSAGGLDVPEPAGGFAGGTPSVTPTPLPSQATECAGPTVRGVDVSDGEGAVDWASVKGAGIGFAYVKATQGDTFEASTFDANWSGTKAAGVRRGAYHFFDPTIDGVAQAQWFLSKMGALDAGDLPPALDIECPDGDDQCLGYPGGSGDAPASDIAQRADDFVSTVEAATGRKPVIYTFVSYFSGNGIDASGMAPDPLWIANYDVTCPGIPSPWSAARFWQDSYDGNVAGIGSVDTDVFFGTDDDLALYATAGG